MSTHRIEAQEPSEPGMLQVRGQQIQVAVDNELHI